MVLGLLNVKAVKTLTPLWLVGIGALAGVVLVALFFCPAGGLICDSGAVEACGVRCRKSWSVVREGVLLYVLVVLLV